MFDSTEVPAWWTELNADQQRAVAHDGPALVIIAGAGTGKTGTVAARVGRLLAEGVEPERILLLTFTRRAAAEMVARAGSIGGRAAASRVVGGTFHSVANRMLRHHAAAAGLGPSFTVLDPGDTSALFSMIRDEHGLASAGRRRFPRADTIAAIWSRMVNAQERLEAVLEASFPWCRDHREPLAEIFAGYVERKRHHRVLDFDDLLLHWRALLASPDAGGPAATGFDHVLVDEYQDTNSIQADIVLGHAAAGAAVTVVGDDAQAIYGFRAASVANLWHFRDSVTGAVVVRLEQNYRSTQPILDVANSVIARSPKLTPKLLRSNRPGRTRPDLRICADEADQSVAVCDRVLHHRELGIELRDQAVLFRAGHHSDHLELELARRDIPFVKFGGLAFLEAAHIKDLMALLRVLDNPYDSLAWHRVLRMCEGVGPASTVRLLGAMGVGGDTTAVGADPLRALLGGSVEFPSRAADDGTRLVGALEAAAGDGDAQPPPSEQIEHLTEFCAPVFARIYDHAAARVADLGQLASTGRRFATRDRLLSELVLDPPARTGDLAGEPSLDDDHLVLSTIHSAKGGEWRSVHLIHAADGNIPSDMALRDADGLDEERRLLYVALTRAKEYLSVTAPMRFHHRPEGDAHNLAPLSRFLDDCRELFDEPVTGDPEMDDRSVVDDRVGLADEVDAAVHALFG